MSTHQPAFYQASIHALRRALVRINGRAQLIATDERTTLAELLRDELGLTGTKEVCGMGNCGACTVIVDDAAVYSCLVLAAECDGHEVETIEGQARGGRLSNVQEAFIACDALQCGFCTPGQVLAVEAELRQASPRRRRAGRGAQRQPVPVRGVPPPDRRRPPGRPPGRRAGDAMIGPQQTHPQPDGRTTPPGMVGAGAGAAA
ncbi:MAG: 2Fe-2S iron-sulfur cluster-binding protein [Acidimicrobiales bacterium]